MGKGKYNDNIFIEEKWVGANDKIIRKVDMSNVVEGMRDKLNKYSPETGQDLQETIAEDIETQFEDAYEKIKNMNKYNRGYLSKRERAIIVFTADEETHSIAFGFYTPNGRKLGMQSKRFGKKQFTLNNNKINKKQAEEEMSTFKELLKEYDEYRKKNEKSLELFLRGQELFKKNGNDYEGIHRTAINLVDGISFEYSRYTGDFGLGSQHGVCFATLQYEDAEKILASLENGNSVTKEDLPQYALDELDKISISNNNDMDPFDG